MYAELAADAVAGVDVAFLAVDHEDARHLLLGVAEDADPVTDEHSRSIHTYTRPLSVQRHVERHFIDVLCTTPSGQEVFNLIATAILDIVEHSGDTTDAMRNTLAR